MPSITATYNELFNYNNALNEKSRLLFNTDYNVYKESKNELLENFFTQKRQVFKEQSDVDLSDNTDISDNDDKKNKKGVLLDKKEPKVTQIMHESRFNKRLDDLINDFFKSKACNEPDELKKFKNNIDYS